MRHNPDLYRSLSLADIFRGIVGKYTPGGSRAWIVDSEQSEYSCLFRNHKDRSDGRDMYAMCHGGRCVEVVFEGDSKPNSDNLIVFEADKIGDSAIGMMQPKPHLEVSRGLRTLRPRESSTSIRNWVEEALAAK